MAIRRGLITVPGLVITLYGIVLASSFMSARTYMPTYLLPWPGLLVQALPNIKTMPVAFVLPPLSCTWRRFHIQCCRRPSFCCTARFNQGNGCAFIVAPGHSLSAMAVVRGIRCAGGVELVKQTTAHSQ
jgi:hypothetical protein